MAFIPKDSKWYLADLVIEITVEGNPRNVIHTNTVLVRADSPEEAYNKAVELGVAQETAYENADGKSVRFRFRGLRDLNVIHDELTHGAELSFSESLGVSETELDEWISRKEELGVFRPITTSEAPDYRSRRVAEEIQAFLESPGTARDPD